MRNLPVFRTKSWSRPTHRGTLWHALRALTRACKLSSTSQSAGESTLNPGTDPAPLQPTAYTCVQDPTTSQQLKCAHRTIRPRGSTKLVRTAAATAPGAMRAQSARIRPVWAVRGSPRAVCRLDRHQGLRGLSSARRLLLVRGWYGDFKTKATRPVTHTM